MLVFLCIWLIVIRSQCPHCSLMPHSHLLKKSFKISWKTIYRSPHNGSTTGFGSVGEGSTPSGASIWSLWPRGLGASLWHLFTQVQVLSNSQKSGRLSYALPLSWVSFVFLDMVFNGSMQSLGACGVSSSLAVQTKRLLFSQWGMIRWAE